ncbi:hypothetical protein PPROV_000930000 [Pycnococcus provasolii]|uniref:RNA helicase n=1 Tax=Pycnococcus provasolii TaxID=41880 RepID=A0A830I0I6_9CHLO|nr:hypothetical protein PPROV_000930000 [Pycnococcus provasolii]
MSSHHTYISDSLISLLGFSAPALVEYVVSLASSTSNSSELTAALTAQGLPDSPALDAFCSQLLSRFKHTSKQPGKVTSKSARPLDDNTTPLTSGSLSRRKYDLLEEDDDDDDEEEEPTTTRGGGEQRQPATHDKSESASASQKHTSSSRRRHRSSSEHRQNQEGGDADAGSTHKRRRRHRSTHKDDDDANDEDDETAVRRAQPKPNTGSAHTDTRTDAEKTKHAADIERERDAAELAAFEERLRARDAERTKKVGGGGGTKEELEAFLDDEAAAEQAAEQDDPEMTNRLRELSRQEYLKKREERKLQELEDTIQDEELLFADVELTEAEKNELARKKELLALAKERAAIANNEDEARYVMPDAYDDLQSGKVRQDKRYAAAAARYKDNADQPGMHQAEQLNWEAEQLRKAGVIGGGASAAAANDDGYEFVIDTVDFVKDAMLAGENVEARPDLEAQAEDEKERLRLEKLSKFEAIQEERRRLPIYKYREELLAAVDEYQTLIIVGETGSGKTTQIAQYLHESGYSERGKIGCTQPRRVATMSVASRVATEMGVKLGHEVGYAIRFEDCTGDKTLLKFMTDGMLLREFLSEPDLAGYSAMIIDEAHERTLHTDVLFGLIKDLIRFRPDLRVLVSSATLDAEKFSAYFDDAPIFRIPGRRYPVEIFYTKQPEADYMDASIVTALQIHVEQPLPGDILIFYTGQEEIEAAEEIFRQRTRKMGGKIAELIICPVYANLPSDMQMKIFSPTPPGARKLVLATNIAETSLTIDGIRHVIDPGFHKQNAFHPKTGMESLLVQPVSKANALQRAGRAGRTASGTCYRLYTAWSYQNELEDNVVPEIQRTNLGNVILMLKSLGIHDLLNFDFMDPPPSDAIVRALEQLYALGALNDRGSLTKLGRRMAEFPLDPMLSKMLIASEQYKVSFEIVCICAMLNVGGSLFYRPKDKLIEANAAINSFYQGNVGDHIGLYNVYASWSSEEVNFASAWCMENFVQVRSIKRARDIFDQLVNLMGRVEIELISNPTAHDAVKKCILSGFFYHTARLAEKLGKSGQAVRTAAGSTGGGGPLLYKTIKAPQQSVYIHPSSALAPKPPKPNDGGGKDGSEGSGEMLVLPPRWVVYHELVYTTREYMRQISEIESKWLVEVAPHMYSEKEIETLNGGDGDKMPNRRGKGKAAE